MFKTSILYVKYIKYIIYNLNMFVLFIQRVRKRNNNKTAEFFNIRYQFKNALQSLTIL